MPTHNTRPLSRVEREAVQQAISHTVDQAKAIIDKAITIWACRAGYDKEKILLELEALKNPAR